jgi:hypothetical protein
VVKAAKAANITNLDFLPYLLRLEDSATLLDILKEIADPSLLQQVFTQKWEAQWQELGHIIEEYSCGTPASAIIERLKDDPI